MVCNMSGHFAFVLEDLLVFVIPLLLWQRPDSNFLSSPVFSTSPNQPT